MKEIIIACSLILGILFFRINNVGFHTKEKLIKEECSITYVGHAEKRIKRVLYETPLKLKCESFDTRIFISKMAVPYRMNQNNIETHLLNQKINISYKPTTNSKCLKEIDGVFKEDFFYFKYFPFLGCTELI